MKEVVEFLRFLIDQHFEKTMAVLGMASGLIGTLVAYIALKRDQGNLLFNVYFADTYQKSVKGLAKISENYVCFTITNNGRRSIVANHIGGAKFNSFLDKVLPLVPGVNNRISRFMFDMPEISEMINQDNRNGRVYDEGDFLLRAILLVKGNKGKDSIGFRNFGCLYVSDSTGKKYYLSSKALSTLKKDMKKAGYE
jgi:hypothetical protein